MEDDVFNVLQTRTVYMPGNYDRHGRLIIIINISSDLQNCHRKYLQIAIAYFKHIISDIIAKKGITVIADAQNSTARTARQYARIIYELFQDVNLILYLVKSEGFWEKHVDTCTRNHHHHKEEPIILSRGRLIKLFDLHHLPQQFGGTLQCNYDLWLQMRKSIDEFDQYFNKTVKSIDHLRQLLQSNINELRPSNDEFFLKKFAQLNANIHNNIGQIIELGNRILARFNEVYSPIPITTTTNIDMSERTTKTSNLNINYNEKSSLYCRRGEDFGKPLLPADLNYERTRIGLCLNDIERRQTELRDIWLELRQNIKEAQQLAILEEGVAFVTNWILTTAEQMLNRQQSIGCNIKACENLMIAHSTLELECRNTYGLYAELLYKIDIYVGSKDCLSYRDLMSQKEFMQFICRSFAARLERRRNILITSLRFFRLINDYFTNTTETFDTLVMGGSIGDFSTASSTLKKLKDSQQSLALTERDLIREGEKLSDMLTMPVKDALGRDLNIDYTADINNVREILQTCLARRKIFGDSVDLQKLTLEQLKHIHTYETDARMAIKWMNDLYNVMIKCHSHVGCNIHEIQIQKDELQTFQETGKSIYNYGCQLLEASNVLRSSCRLNATEVIEMQTELKRIWCSLQAISQEHMTRLRVSAVFHRSVKDYYQQLLRLKMSLRQLFIRQHRQQQIEKQQLHCSQALLNETEIMTTITITKPPLLTPTINSNNLQEEKATESNSSSPLDAESNYDGSELNNESYISHNNNNNNDNDDNNNSNNDNYNEDNGEYHSLLNDEHLRRYLMEREQLLVEVGRMVRLGRLLKTRLKEPFVLDSVTGKSIVMDDLHVAISPSPIINSNSANSSNDSASNNIGILNESYNEPNIGILDHTKIIIHPICNNNLACNAISTKLIEIAQVAESLDAVIRNIQDNETSSSCLDPESSLDSSQDKKLLIDWQSRSTEDELFVTASEGNYTPHSISSASFQTASGRTSSFISCDKNSYDTDDMTFTYELSSDHVISPLNTSVDSSEQSYQSAQQQQQQLANILPVNIANVKKNRQLINNNNFKILTEDVGIDLEYVENHTPETVDMDVLTIESETDLEVSVIAAESYANNVDNINNNITTKTISSITSETSPYSIHSSVVDEPFVQIRQQQELRRQQEKQKRMQREEDEQQQECFNKSNINWRHNKYYENITKQTIKGFL